jgi:carbon storage regulator CsrA
LVVVAIRGSQVRLGFDAPREVAVRRSELQRRDSPDDAPAVFEIEATELFDLPEVAASSRFG